MPGGMLMNRYEIRIIARRVAIEVIEAEIEQFQETAKDRYLTPTEAKQVSAELESIVSNMQVDIKKLELLGKYKGKKI